MGSSLPISSGKALVQTETRLVSYTRRKQPGGQGRAEKSGNIFRLRPSLVKRREETVTQKDWLKAEAVPKMQKERRDERKFKWNSNKRE